ncbi:MAG: hypothetical protein IPF52_16585 [Saprospiraceae bacterium]|nr:hypothetical protein [Saprospiraceae bacterium]
MFRQHYRNSGTAIIPGQLTGITVSYYIFQATAHWLNWLPCGHTGIGEVGYDMATLNLINNAGPNYAYTVFNPVTVNATGGTTDC